MNNDITVALTYSEEEAREVVRAFLYFTSNVSATREDQDRMSLIRSAIKASIPPPKVEEPLGLYARIEDSEGRVWVRTATQASVWRPESVNSAGRRYLIPHDAPKDYADIAAVRVLSKGVS